MNAIVLVFIGAGIGGVLRYVSYEAAMRVFGMHFPSGTFVVNVVGSFVIGCIAGWMAMKGGASWGTPVRLFVMAGILGGFTTFSSFSLDTAMLVQRGEVGLAAFYVAGSVALSLTAVFGGLALVRAVA